MLPSDLDSCAELVRVLERMHLGQTGKSYPYSERGVPVLQSKGPACLAAQMPHTAARTNSVLSPSNGLRACVPSVTGPLKILKKVPQDDLAHFPAWPGVRRTPLAPHRGWEAPYKVPP